METIGARRCLLAMLKAVSFLAALAISCKASKPDNIDFSSHETTRSNATNADEPPPAEAGRDESGGTGTAMALDEGAMGKRDSDRADGHMRMKSVERARSAGVLGSSSGDYASGYAQAQVAAGEWDDNANYRDYLKWVSKTEQEVVQHLHVSNRKFIVVTDRKGKPMPNCPVTIKGGGSSFSLVTMASGRALLFPEKSAKRSLIAMASCGGRTGFATVDVQKDDAVTKLVLWTDRELPARRPIDIAFVLDTTGSMGEEIEAVKSTIRSVADQLAKDQIDIRIGLVEYRDRSDQVVTRTFPFSSDLAAFSRSVSVLTAEGGGDTPEDMQLGLSTALDKLQWRSDAVARMMVVIADAPPHLDYTNEKDYGNTAFRAAARGIKIYTVAASGMDDIGQIVMRQMSQFTGATNMFVLRGGAGPQSVGGGDPKSSCGGTHTNYSSGNLDQLIIDKIRRELRSIDADPMLIPGRDQDERAKPCDKRITTI